MDAPIPELCTPALEPEVEQTQRITFRPVPRPAYRRPRSNVLCQSCNRKDRLKSIVTI